MNNKGFLLIDSLITIVIVSSIAILCFGVFKTKANYEEGYILYKEEMNNQLTAIYDELGECELCIVIEEDSSQLEQY